MAYATNCEWILLYIFIRSYLCVITNVLKILLYSIDPFHLSLEHVWLGVLTKLLDVGSRYLQWRMPMGKNDFSLSSLSDLPQVAVAYGSIVCLQIKLKSNKAKTYPLHKHVIIISMPSGTPSG
jgi:hypothetical protein